MDSQNFKVGELVWAKMKGYPFWPAKIAKPQSDAKKPAKYKNAYFVHFFGSNNFAWILANNIKLHSESMFESLKAKKVTGTYQNAVDALKVCLKSNKRDKSTSPKLLKDSAKRPPSRVVNVFETDAKKPQGKIAKAFKTVAKKPQGRVVNVFKTVAKKPERRVAKFPHKKVSRKRIHESDAERADDYSKYKFPKLKESIDRIEELIFSQFECLRENLRRSVELKNMEPTDKKIGSIDLGNTKKPDENVVKFPQKEISEKRVHENDVNSEDDCSKYKFPKLKESLDKTEELVYSLNTREII